MKEIIDTLLLIIPVISIICTLITLYVLLKNTNKNEKKENNINVKRDTEIDIKLDMLLSGNGSIKSDIKEIDNKFSKKFDDVNERLIRVEESTKQAHKRLDDISKEG